MAAKAAGLLTLLGGGLWLVPYGVMLAGLTILVTNMIRTLWRASRRRNIIRNRLRG